MRLSKALTLIAASLIVTSLTVQAERDDSVDYANTISLSFKNDNIGNAHQNKVSPDAKHNDNDGYEDNDHEHGGHGHGYNDKHSRAVKHHDDDDDGGYEDNDHEHGGHGHGYDDKHSRAVKHHDDDDDDGKDDEPDNGDDKHVRVVIHLRRGDN